MRAISAASCLSAITILTIAASAPSAEARPVLKFQGCNRGDFCLYEHSDGHGLRISFKTGTDNLATITPKPQDRPARPHSGELDNGASAVWNRDWRPWCLYEHPGTGSDRGRSTMIRRGFKGSIAGRSSGRLHWNDQASAVRPAQWVSVPGNPPASHFAC
jgi:Peptidase inhibitor family I36